MSSHDLSGSGERLRECLSGGTAFHNSNLTRDERVVVERHFRDPKGGIEVLASTTTLAAGINTPASIVILAEQEFIGEDGRPFTVAEYKNMAGRAGRLGPGRARRRRQPGRVRLHAGQSADDRGNRSRYATHRP